MGFGGLSLGAGLPHSARNTVQVVAVAVQAETLIPTVSE